MGKKILIVFLVIIVVAGIALFAGKQTTQAPEGNIPTATTPTEEVPAASGNIDDAVTAILKDSMGNEIPTGEDDPTLFSEDSQALDGFGQSLDGSQF